MSHPMSNREIEDVLSSIRRLVAQESRPQPERLVLTEAQRVAAPETDAAPPGSVGAKTPGAGSEPVSETAPASVAVPEMPQADPNALEATISELEAALGTGAVKAEANAPRAATRPVPAAPAGLSAKAEPEAEDEADLIDEDELARMIARLVREELRGQLGEKITLQVRKLVRAEVAKALDESKLLG